MIRIIALMIMIIMGNDKIWCSSSGENKVEVLMMIIIIIVIIISVTIITIMFNL